MPIIININTINIKYLYILNTIQEIHSTKENIPPLS